MSSSLTIVSPVYNESKNISFFVKEIENISSQIAPFDVQITEVILINDGSSDDSLKELSQLQSENFKITIINLSRNFGKESAILAGLQHVKTDLAVLMDSDLQHPPSYILDFLTHWQKGYDVVYAYRQNRTDEKLLKKFGTGLYYFMMKFISPSYLKKDTSDFRLMSARAIDAFIRLRERSRFSKGLFAWIGFEQKGIPYIPGKRYGGKSKFSLLSLFSFGVLGAVSFSTKPLHIATAVGFMISFFSFWWILWIIAEKILFGIDVPGYPTLLSAILFMSGIQFILIGILGEYIGRIHMEVKNRPNYIIADKMEINPNNE